MKITVLRKMKYQNISIYVMQFDYCFQYLFPYGSDIYQNHVFLLPPLWKRILYRLGLIKNLYNKDQTEEGERVVLSGAITTIDELNDPKARVARRKAEEESQRKELAQKIANSGCVWQAREGKHEMYYMCLTHNKISKMVEGEKPSHN